jgi:hypothetical protein
MQTRGMRLNMLLIRSYLKDRTIGWLSNGLVTLERPWLNNQVSVSCIPEGVYKVKRDKTGRFQWYRLESVVGRTNIEIHGGVLPEHSEGCILVGMFHDTKYNLKGSDIALNQLLSEIGDNSFELTIRQYDPNVDSFL